MWALGVICYILLGGGSTLFNSITRSLTHYSSSMSCRLFLSFLVLSYPVISCPISSSYHTMPHLISYISPSLLIYHTYTYTGYPPFHDENQRQLFIKIKNVEYEFHTEYWGHVSADAKDLIASMLTKGTYFSLTK